MLQAFLLQQLARGAGLGLVVTVLLHIIFYKNVITVLLWLTRKIRCDTLVIAVIELQSFLEMILKLKDIATVSSGVTFRSRIEATKDGNVRVIQMKDLGDDNFVHLSESIHIDHTKPKSNQLAKLGDIIFRSRGQTNTAALLNEEVESTIVAAPLFRVRPDIKKVVPEFLLWWINQPSSQSYLASISKGTMVKMVSKHGLEDLEVNPPSLEQQKKVVEIFSLSMREQQLLEEIKNRKAIYTQGILMQMASESRQTASNKKTGFDTATFTPGQTQSRARN